MAVRLRAYTRAVLFVLAAAALGGTGTALFSRHHAPTPAIPVLIAPIDAIERGVPARTTVFRLAEAPAVLVVAFVSAHEQALALNRVAALVEKAGFPRDHVLSQADLAARLHAQAIEPDDFYEGHDYRAADLARFVALAPNPLPAAEARMRDIARQEGWLQPGATGALISIPPVGPHIDAADRTTILRHELSHAAYFTDPAYRAFTTRFWTTALSEAERAAFRAWLAAQGYDPANEDLMQNEAQAYLIHTVDPRYFAPAMIGMAPERYATLRTRLIDAMDDGWLKASARATHPPATISGPPSPAPPHPPPRAVLAPPPPPSPLAARADTALPAPAPSGRPAAHPAPPR